MIQDKKSLNWLKETEEHNFFQTYKRLSLHITHGDGCYLITDSNEKILDMFAGLAVNILGYNHPKINSAIEEQIKKYIHISNYFYQDKQVELAEKILRMSGYRKIFFTNSGTESIETAIKLVRKYFKGTDKRELISFSGSFHGRTMGGLSLTARKKYREDFEPFLPDIKHLTYNDADELKKEINGNTAAVFIEFIQGEGGVIPAKKEFISELFELRDEFDFLIVADEIQSGVGRTGMLHSFEHYQVRPDIVTLAKGIGGGLPLGAVLGNERVKEVFTYGNHGSTFGGNPVAAACGCAIFDELQNGLMVKIISLAGLLLSNLSKLKNKFTVIKEVRGIGLMIGIEVDTVNDGNIVQQISEEMMNRNILVNTTNGNVIRLLPPYIITESEVNLFIEVFEEVLLKITE